MYYYTLIHILVAWDIKYSKPINSWSWLIEEKSRRMLFALLTCHLIVSLLLQNGSLQL